MGFFDEVDFREVRPNAIKKELKLKFQEVDMVLELCEKELGVDKVRQFRAEVKVKLGSPHGTSHVTVANGNSRGSEVSSGGSQNSQVLSTPVTPETRKTTGATSMISTQKHVQEMEAPEETQKRKRHTSKDNEASARKKKGKHGDEDNLGYLKAVVEVPQNIAKDRSGPEEVLEQIEREMNDRRSKFEFSVIRCRSIRVGSYKAMGNEASPLKVTITALGICFTLPSSVSKIRQVKVCIPRNNILSIQASPTKRLPVIFLKTGAKYAKWVRDVLGMNGSPDNDHTNYYCPQTGSNCQRTITILTESFSEADVGLLRKMYADTLIEIDYQLANKFLKDITPKTYETTTNYQPDSNSPAATVSTSASTNIETSSSSVVPSSQPPSALINNGTGDRASANSSQSLGTTTTASGDYDQEATIWIYEGKNTKIPISPKAIAGLGQSELINDQIIDFWLSVIYSELLSDTDRERTFVYDSFFYSKLTEKRKWTATFEDGTLAAPERRHARVKNRTKNVDIFGKDFLIIPINEDGQWLIVIICFPGMQGYHDYNTLKSLPNYSVEPFSHSPAGAAMGRFRSADTRVKHPCILLFDSFAWNTRSRVFATLREYLRIEYKSKKGAERAFDKLDLPGLMPKVPQQQPNSTDSGLFMLQYIESFFSHPLHTYDTKGIHLKSWFDPLVAENKRKVIYDFIKKKIEEQCPHHLARIPDVNFDPDPDQCEVDSDEQTILMSSLDDPDFDPETPAIGNATLTNATT